MSRIRICLLLAALVGVSIGATFCWAVPITFAPGDYDNTANAVVAGVPAQLIRMREAPRLMRWE